MQGDEHILLNVVVFGSVAPLGQVKFLEPGFYRAVANITRVKAEVDVGVLLLDGCPKVFRLPVRFEVISLSG